MAITDIIKGLGVSQAIRLTELGKIKIGGLGASRPTQGGGTFRMPRKDDHFTITTLTRVNGEPKGDLIPDRDLMVELTDLYGDDDGKLRQIPIRLLSNDVDEVLQSAFVWYGGKTVGARSDGTRVVWTNDPHTGRRNPSPIEEEWKPEMLEMRDSRGNKLFKLHSVFNCVVASRESRFGGVYKFRTTSVISFKQLYASLLHVHQLTGGILTNLPLFMVVRPIQVAPDGKPSTVYVVHVEIRGASIDEVQIRAQKQMQFALENHKRMAAAQNEYRKLLAAPGEEGQDEAEDISAEFHPEMDSPEPAPATYDIIDAESEVVVPIKPIPPAPVTDQGQPPASSPIPSPAPSSSAAQAPSENKVPVGSGPLTTPFTDDKNPSPHAASALAATKESLNPAPKAPKSTGRPAKAAPVPPEQQQAAPTPSESMEAETTTQCPSCQGFTQIDAKQCHICGFPFVDRLPAVPMNQNTGEPSPEEKRRIAAEEFVQDTSRLKGWIMQMRTMALVTPLYAKAVEKSKPKSEFIGDWTEGELKRVAFGLKLAILERDAKAKK